MNRRIFLKDLAVAVTGFSPFYGCRKKNYTASSEIVDFAAVSLTALQAALRKGTNTRKAYPTIPGPNRLIGFVRSESGDIILFGFSDRERPPIEVDAFAIALRNAYQVAETYQGDPGCTIDPREGDAAWRLHDVTVFGMPHNCRVAARHVRLDAELKWVGAGIRSQSDLPVESAFDIWRKHNQTCGGSNSREVFYHRFWFYPLQASAPRFSRCQQNVEILMPVGVQLLTEQEFRDKQGHRVGATGPTAGAQEFCAQVTKLLGSTQVRRYMELVNDFRIIEVARLMRFVDIESTSLGYFLEAHALDIVEVPRVLPGVQREEQGTATCEATTRQLTQGVEINQRLETYQHTYRGGVEARVIVDEPSFMQTENCGLTGVRDSIIAARPSIDTVAWSVPHLTLANAQD